MAFTLNGVGTKYLGTRWLPDGTYITTKWFVLVFIPLFPIGSIRVVESTGTYGSAVLSGARMKAHKVPLDVRMVLREYLCGILGFAAFVIAMLTINWALGI